ncbi:unnamed protein product [Gordionus sp. m RMFG-2023]
MGNKVNRAHLEGAKKTGCLNLSDSNMKELPPQLIRMADCLRNLDISHNKLNKLPSNMETFVTLKILNISFCNLKELPNSINTLVKLENLIANNNDIAQLPDTFVALKNLKNLSLNLNKFKMFPQQILSLGSLTTLDLSNNLIVKLPNEIELIQCIEINLNYNQLTQLPEGLSKCPRLKVIRLEHNSLTPHSIPPSIFRDSTLCIISLDGNKFLHKDLQNSPGYSEVLILNNLKHYK